MILHKDADPVPTYDCAAIRLTFGLLIEN